MPMYVMYRGGKVLEFPEATEVDVVPSTAGFPTYRVVNKDNETLGVFPQDIVASITKQPPKQ